jgi:hypothetical protein
MFVLVFFWFLSSFVVFWKNMKETPYALQGRRREDVKLKGGRRKE